MYHLTHIRTLAQILEAGALVAGATPAFEASSALTRELRATAEVVPGVTVAGYVPFFLSPNATLWQELRSGAVESTRWSEVARAAASTDFVMLVTTIDALGSDIVITDDDAAASLTRFAGTPDDRARLFARLTPEQLLAAEVLAPARVELDEVQLIGVANDPMREQVRGMLATALERGGAAASRNAGQPKVAVYPPWFRGE